MIAGTTADGWSAYDDAVPHATGLPAVVAATSALRGRRGPGADLDLVRDVVVVVSASRGGSTLFGELLRRTPGLLALRAEVNPLFALAGLHEGPERRRVLRHELALDVGRPAPPGPLGADERGRLVLDLAWRLAVQWPAAADALGADGLAAAADEAVGPVGADHDPLATVLRAVAALRARGVAADPWYYDGPDAALAAAFPDLPVPTGPPSPAVVEMAPFVSVDRWAPAGPGEGGTLVLSTPRLSFRLAFLRDLFPAARLRVVHLTRNPAASTNGLVDGWLHRGFGNVAVPGGLRIPGYSDVVPGGDRWWCYDLPPGWEAWTDRPLAEVCAFQWRATHEAALAAIAELDLDHVRVRFEDVVGPPARRDPLLADLAAWLGVDGAALAEVAGAELPVVMATEPPRPRRWLDRAEVLRPALADPDVRALAARLGYDDEASWV